MFVTDVEGEGPYARASYIPKLQKTKVMALHDLDGTLTDGEGLPSGRELSDRAAVRQLLEERGVVAGAVTARTCGLTLSSKKYRASTELSVLEPPPHWGVDKKTSKHVYVPLEEVDYLRHCLDWDLTAGFGSRIIVKNGARYKVDRDYENLLQYDYAMGKINPDPWRHAMLAFLFEALPNAGQFMSKLDNRFNYDRGVSNVAPLDFRFQFQFEGQEGLERMKEIKATIDSARVAGNPLAVRIAMVDESRVHRTDPEQNRYTLYLIPWGARKEKMIHRLFSQSAKAAGMETRNLRLLYAGDTMTDLRSGLWAGGDAELTFLLASGSRLAPYLLEKADTYGNEDLSFLWARGKRTDHRLVATSEKGVYQFVHKIRGKRRNTVVIGDERYSGTTAPGSVTEFLKEFL